VTKICLNCNGIENNDSVRYCSHCGTKFPQNNSEALLDLQEVLIKSNRETSKFNKALLFAAISTLVFSIITLIVDIADVKLYSVSILFIILIFYVIFIVVGLIIILNFEG